MSHFLHRTIFIAVLTVALAIAIYYAFLGALLLVLNLVQPAHASEKPRGYGRSALQVVHSNDQLATFNPQETGRDVK